MARRRRNKPKPFNPLEKMPEYEVAGRVWREIHDRSFKYGREAILCEINHLIIEIMSILQDRGEKVITKPAFEMSRWLVRWGVREARAITRKTSSVEAYRLMERLRGKYKRKLDKIISGSETRLLTGV